ncbi:hypothetical protein F5I97DRAFT_1109603 [Phlebopus sp. FC_14]|nr:hypothetical protein F5I97DRAFT_1109603 [Phlebopus sp. FC_14]
MTYHLQTNYQYFPTISRDLDENDKANVEDAHTRRCHDKVFEIIAYPRPIFCVKARNERTYLEDLAQDTWKYGLLLFREWRCGTFGRIGRTLYPGIPVPWKTHPRKWMIFRDATRCGWDIRI